MVEKILNSVGDVEVKLWRKHPTLFKTILLIAISNLLISAFTLFDSPKASLSFTRITTIGALHSPAFWYISFAFTGVFCLHGALTSKYFMARVGLALSSALGGFLAIGFWLSYFTSPKAVGISAPVVWSFYTLICIINSAEPAANPLSATLQQNIHKTIAKDRGE
jgi:hypothetical protein